jgi:hypothetical protein
MTFARTRRWALVLSIVTGTAAVSAACEDGGDDLAGRRGYSGSRPPTTGDAGLTEAEAYAFKLFRALEEDFDKVCGGACHAEGGSGAPTWLKGPDRYYSIKQFPGIIVADPYQSKLLTRGVHAGPDLKGPNQGLGDRITQWLTAEALALKKKALPGTDPFVVSPGPNSIDVSKGGAGVDGTKINFNATITGKLLSLDQLVIAAPGGTAVRVAHPVFVIVNDKGEQRDDPVDSFSNVDQRVAAGKTAPLGAGRLILTDWAASNKMRITFTTLEPTQIEADAGLGGGCKSQATFDSSAVPAIQSTQCLTCHQGQNQAATNALNLSTLATDRAAACAQALTKVNLANKPQSPIILHVSGGTTHPFTVPDATAWRNAMLGWINNE